MTVRQALVSRESQGAVTAEIDSMKKERQKKQGENKRGHKAIST